VTTTSCSISSSPGITLISAAALAALAAAPACSDDGNGESGDCSNEETPTLVGHPSAALRLATVRVLHSVEGSQTERSVLASFTDVTEVDTSSRRLDTNIGDSTCFALTGTVTKTCRKGYTDPCVIKPLAVTGVKVEGLGSGTVTPTKPSSKSSSYTKDNIPSPLFGASPVKARVTGTSAKDAFPTFELSSPPPAVLQLECPEAAKPVGQDDFEICWNAGDPKLDYVIIEVRTTDTSVTDKAICFEIDDGCHTIRAGVLDWLDVDVGSTFTVTISRERNTVKKIDDTTSAKLELISKVKLTLTR
jgi:hypothetical protein